MIVNVIEGYCEELYYEAYLRKRKQLKKDTIKVVSFFNCYIKKLY